jgi:transcriptional regulator with XRE-family HTH domain
MSEQKIKPAELARRAKISKDAVSSYTTMRSLPSEETLAKLAKVFKCKPEELLDVTNEDPGMNPVVEIREYNKSGYKLLVARVPVPEEQVAALFNQLLAFAKTHKRR